jgi:hypothetical protein
MDRGLWLSDKDSKDKLDMRELVKTKGIPGAVVHSLF